MDYSFKKVSEVLNKNDFQMKKKFGQNFIVDNNIIDSIINKADIDDDTLVIEIGPGAGALTNRLVKAAKNVVCYEIDKNLKSVLDELLNDTTNLEIIYEDFLNRNIKEDLKNYNYSKLYVVANLPYYITTPIILKLIEDDINVDKIVVMVQKEVGDRFKALPGSKDYSSLSVFLNYYFDIKKVIDVSRNVFRPIPNVDSIVVEFKRKNEILEVKNRELFFKLIKDSFQYKRKNLRNNLKQYNLEKIEYVLKRHNMDLSYRAEQLSLEIFVELANYLD